MVMRFPEQRSASVCKCNKCGKDIPLVGFFGIKDYTMPYGSKYDFDTLNLVLCTDCLDELIDGCVISPITEYAAIQQ